MNLSKKLFSGKDVEDALEKASLYYNVNPELIHYTVITTDNSLFSPLAGEVTIRIDAIGKSSKGKVKPEGSEKVENLLNSWFKLAGFNVSSYFSRVKDGIEFEIKGEDEELFLDENGALLDAFQHLVNKAVTKGSDSKPVVLECRSFRFNRVKELREMAKKAAEKVKSLGKPYIFSPMNPAERRQIHITLKDDKFVATESLGNGFLKKVKVYLKKKK
ncbi:spoIIIJ-associated protein [Thermotomaculum hydrothermale]|uniref:SpoIIIJ-associated protein n=1 Tax=Thermotomaculum hydrothermale TaxID=981385 RepID=A0A7R6PGR7_9BACT|nr:R3H domain-containing nucleic acid-binding protein [Thermotomaculum hydrothermale]BBB33483.1 spoIIIJ-associated protein [Thermotomaculum hydrothermale]